MNHIEGENSPVERNELERQLSDGTDLGRDILANIGQSPQREHKLRVAEHAYLDSDDDEDIERAADVSYHTGGPGADYMRPSIGQIIYQPRKSLIPSGGMLTQPDEDLKIEDQ